jgi:hypothetical protein
MLALIPVDPLIPMDPALLRLTSAHRVTNSGSTCAWASISTYSRRASGCEYTCVFGAEQRGAEQRGAEQRGAEQSREEQSRVRKDKWSRVD